MELIHSGQKLSINIIKDDKLIEIIGVVTEVLDDRISIELPKYFMRYIEFLEVGKPLTVKIFSKLGTVDFNTVVITSPLEERFTIELDYNAVKLTPDSDLKSVDAIETLILKDKDVSYTVKTTSISIETIICVSTKPLEVDQKFDCELILPQDYGTIFFKATVTKRDIVYDNEYTLSCYAMNEDNRQSLLYYMYMYTLKYSQQEDE